MSILFAGWNESTDDKAVIEELVGVDFLVVVDRLNLVVDRVEARQRSDEGNPNELMVATIKLISRVTPAFSCDFCLACYF